MSSTNTFICLLFVALSWSCVKDDRSGCPVITVAAIDKNYDNAAEVGFALLDENLPILSHINSLVLRNYVAATGSYRVYDEILPPGEPVHTIASSRFSSGLNRLTAIGGSGVEAKQYTEQNTVTLHPGGLEGEDIHIGYGEIEYPPAANRTIELYRAKGMLMVEPVNMPADTRTMDVSISGLYATADGGTDGMPLYAGAVAVSKSFDVTAEGSGGRFSTILSPSTAGNTSPLGIVFNFADGTRDNMSLDVAILRNHITLVRPEYNPATRTWNITVMVDGKWVAIENLTITQE